MGNVTALRNINLLNFYVWYSIGYIQTNTWIFHAYIISTLYRNESVQFSQNIYSNTLNTLLAKVTNITDNKFFLLKALNISLSLLKCFPNLEIIIIQ